MRSPTRQTRVRAVAGVLRWFIALCVIALAPDAAYAQLGAGSSAGHVWLVMPDAETGGAVLLHAPPRRSDPGERFRASEPGTLRVARRLAFVPDGIAAIGDAVTLVLPTRPGVGDAPALGPRAITLRAVPTPMSDFWAYEPHGRFLPERPLPDALEVLAVSTLDEQVLVLGRLEDRWWLARLAPDSWSPIPVPAEAQGAESLVLTRPTSGGLGLVDPSPPGSWRAWSWHAGEADAGWRRSTLAANPRRPLGDGAVFLVGRNWFAARPSPGGIDISTLDETRETLLASIDRVPGGASIGASADAGGRLVAVWRRDAPAGAEQSDEVEVIEVSLATGVELYRGDPVHVAPISAAQFRMLAAGLVALAVIALLIVLGPGETPIVLPEGWSLAEPSRRFIATALDASIAATLCAAIFRVPVLDVLTFNVLVAGDGSWVVLPATLGAGAVIGTVLEWLVGCTLGKAAVGCRVVGVRAADAARAKAQDAPSARPRLWQAAVRNVIKWVLPPVAALALLDSTGRHRGDVLSRTAVVLPAPPEPDAQ